MKPLNEKTPSVIIAQENGVTLDNCDNWPLEDIENPKFCETKYQQLFPPVLQFKDTYELWCLHQSCYWSIHENDPSVDAPKFSTLDAPFKDIVLKMIGCILVGDGIVIDKMTENLMLKITSIELLALLTDIAAREFTHKAMYSKMLEVSSEAQDYRSADFSNDMMGAFHDIGIKYESDDIRLKMYFIMICENILFAPMFQTICYLATLGLAPKLCDSNILAMRDEYLHYKNARLQLSKMKNKIDIHLARAILAEFVIEVHRLCHKIIGNFDDGVYNVDHVLEHFNYIVYNFMMENNLFISDDYRIKTVNNLIKSGIKTIDKVNDCNNNTVSNNAIEEPIESKSRISDHICGKPSCTLSLLKTASVLSKMLVYVSSPAAKYMSLPDGSIKINLMESNSTTYLISGNNEEIDMNF